MSGQAITPTEIGTLTVHRDDDIGKVHPCLVTLGLLLASAAVVLAGLYALVRTVLAVLT